MTVLMLYPGILDRLPPLLTAAVCLSHHGAEVTVVCAGASEACAEYLRSHRVCLKTTGFLSYPASRAGKLRLQFRTGLVCLREYRRARPDVVWYHDGHGMRYGCWKPRALVVAHAHEMYRPGTALGWVQRSVIRRADVCIVPEENRRWILSLAAPTQAEWFTIPNRPAEDFDAGPADTGYTLELFRRHGGDSRCAEFLIYQGVFRRERCLLEIVRAFGMVRSVRVGLILLGDSEQSPDLDDYSKEVKCLAALDRRIAVIPRISPPGHLQVTRGCVCGFLLYAPIDLNNVYCAPNKLFEYASSGISMIFPDYPGIAALNSVYAIGQVCDPTDPQSIFRAIDAALSRDRREVRVRAGCFLSETPRPVESYEAVYRCLARLMVSKVVDSGSARAKTAVSN